MRTLYLNIGQLVGITHGELRKAGHDMAHVEIIHDAWLAEKDGRIEAFGQGTPPEALRQEAKVVDTQGAMVMPRFCDSHTHLVWAGSREQEFEDKLRGLSYAAPRRYGRRARDAWKSSRATDSTPPTNSRCSAWRAASARTRPCAW